MLAARNVKSVGRAESGLVKFTSTGANVAGAYAGMLIVAFVGVGLLQSREKDI